jgi:hypothetical protein
VREAFMHEVHVVCATQQLHQAGRGCAHGVLCPQTQAVVTAALGGVVVMGVIGGAVGRQMAARSEAMAAGAGDAAAGGGGGANTAGNAAGYGRGTVLFSILVILEPGRFFGLRVTLPSHYTFVILSLKKMIP